MVALEPDAEDVAVVTRTIDAEDVRVVNEVINAEKFDADETT